MTNARSAIRSGQGIRRVGTPPVTSLERLVRGYYQQAAKLVVDTGGDDALALYLTKADPLLVLRDLLGHASVTTTQAYLHLLDTQRIYRDAYESAAPNPVVDDPDECNG